MWKLYLLASVAGCAMAQSSLTVTASRPANAAADLVVLSVDVSTPNDTGRDAVFAALQGSIVTPANFTGLGSSYQYVVGNLLSSNGLDWRFSVTAPIGNFKSTVTQLQALQQSVAQKKNGMSVSFSVSGTQVSPQAQQSITCAATDLLADARARKLRRWQRRPAPEWGTCWRCRARP
jgi:hypothetical protein